MNILFLANNSLSPTLGGIERTTFNLITELSKDPLLNVFAVFTNIPQKIRDVVCIQDVIHDGKQINNYIELYSIDIIVFPAGAWYTNLLKFYKPATNCKIITCLHSPPKVGEEYIIKNLNLEWRKKSFVEKLKGTSQYLFTYFRQPLKVYKARRQYKIGYANSDAYVLLSRSYFDLFRKYARIENVGKLYAIGNALSFEEDYKIEDLAQKKDMILVVGRFDEISKRISYALKVWKQLKHKKWKFKIVGFGKDESIYHNMVKEFNLTDVFFEGKQDPLIYYAEAKIFLMTSSFEGWPMTLLEALQTGCVPVVMDSFGSLHDIIEDNFNGLIIENDDIAGMVNKVQFLIDNGHELLRLSKNAIESSSKFSSEKIAIQWKQLFNKIVSE